MLTLAWHALASKLKGRLLCRHHKVQIDRTALQHAPQQQEEEDVDKYSMYQSKALQAELQRLDAQDQAAQIKHASASNTR